MSNVETVEVDDTNARIKKKAIIAVLAFITAAVAAVIVVATLQFSGISERLDAVKESYGLDNAAYGSNATQLRVTMNGRELTCKMPSSEQIANHEALKCDDGNTIPAAGSNR